MLKKERASFVGVLVDLENFIFQSGEDMRLLRKKSGERIVVASDLPGFSLNRPEEGQTFRFELERQVEDGHESTITLSTRVLSIRRFERFDWKLNIADRNLILE